MAEQLQQVELMEIIERGHDAMMHIGVSEMRLMTRDVRDGINRFISEAIPVVERLEIMRLEEAAEPVETLGDGHGEEEWKAAMSGAASADEDRFIASLQGSATDGEFRVALEDAAEGLKPTPTIAGAQAPEPEEPVIPS